MILEDVPGNRIRFATGQAGHDGIQVAADDAGLAVTRCGAFVQAGCGRCFDDDEFRRVVFVEIGEVADDGTGQGTDTGLDEDVRRPFDALRFRC